MKWMKRLIWLGLAATLPACDDDGGGSAAADGGGALDGGTGDAEPPFNYIPLNDNACALDEAAPALATAADQAITRLLTGQNTLVAQGLEVCGLSPSNGCPACAAADNPMARLLADLDNGLTDYIATQTDDVDLSGGLVGYFQRALRFPYRYITATVSECRLLGGGACPAGSVTRVVLAQGKEQSCVGNPANCNHYSVEPESLSASCNAFPMALYGAAPTTGGGKKNYENRLFVDARDDVTFGFLVPLTDMLPPDAAALTDEQLEAWLAQLEVLENSIAVRIHDPIVKLALATDGKSGCGTLTGLVPKSTFVTLFADEGEDISDLFNDVVLPRYVEPNNPDYIKAVLSFRLESGTFTSGVPCSAGACGDDMLACNGNVLTAAYSNDGCIQPRPATYTSGAAISAVCAPAAPTPWSIDCADLGGTCGNNRCSTAWRTPEAGEVAFTEIMAEPAGAVEEWMELTNLTGDALDLSNCVLRGRTGEVGEKVTLRTPGPLVLGPGDSLVVSQGATVGNAPRVYQQGGDLALSGAPEDQDLLRLFCDGTLIDEVIWDGTEFGMQADTALQLAPGTSAANNDDPAHWCLAPNPAGTPGAPNPACP